ncbi:NBR1-Ig-like domain-containing protein [Dactylosporangium sp. NPDC051541]|uniref:NBR1-Ig-like domain-containing protein n=1 Tax=Dactylosporangium sp. NPDC051541 TaxID=3363977 RepID=UPI0037A2999A
MRAFLLASLIAGALGGQISPSDARAATETHVTSSDLKVVRTLRSVDLTTCINQIMGLSPVPGRTLAQRQAAATASCAALNSSSNEFPPSSFNGEGGWQRFVGTKEYRGYATLPRYDLKCLDGAVATIATAGSATNSPGYTKDAVPGVATAYAAAESPTSDIAWSGLFATAQPVYIEASDHKSVVVSVRTAARIAYVDRIGQYGALGYDAPFIWFALHEKLSCDGTKRATVTYSDFPGITVYANNNQVDRDQQSVELGRFISNGGRLPTALTPGIGRFDPICRTYAVNASGYTVPAIPSRPLKADCTVGKETGWLLDRRDYAVSVYPNQGLASSGNITPVALEPPPPPPTAIPAPTTPTPKPAAPTLRSSGKTSTTASLSWSKVGGATSYTVYDGTTSVGTTTDPTVTKTITGLAPASTHRYTVRARNSAGESASSNTVQVKTLDSYTYSFVSQSASGDLAHARPGQEFTVTLKVKNTGTATWSPSGAAPVFLGTTRPNDRASAMQASGWITPTRPARLLETSVTPGGTGTFVFPVRTPDRAGALTEYFTLVAENTSWFNDTGVSVTITTIPIVGAAARPGTNGQWNVAADGGVFAEGGAPFFGSHGGSALNAPIVGIAATRSGNGYWLVGADGGVFAYGDASFLGSMAGKPLNRPIVGIAATPSGQGYWLVGGDGGVFAYGDAVFLGSMGGKALNAAVVGIAATPSGRGYWLVGGDGGVFAYGDAQFAGSMVDRPLNKPIVGIASDGTDGGYFLVGGDGGMFAFGSAQFLGSAGSSPTTRPTVGMSVRAAGYLTIDAAGASRFYNGTVSAPAPPPPPPAPPAAQAEPTALYANQTLDAGTRLVSGNQQYALVMQGDGNLVEYAPGGRPVWASGTNVPGTVLVNQGDGNIVLVAPGNRAIWATGTNGNPNSVLVVQDDANVVVYAPGNRPIWASGTHP